MGVLNGGFDVNAIGSGTLTNGLATVTGLTISPGITTVIVQRTGANASTALGHLTVTSVTSTSFGVNALNSSALTETGDQSSFHFACIG